MVYIDSFPPLLSLSLSSSPPLTFASPTMELDLECPLPAFQDLHSPTIPSLFHIESDHMPSQTHSQSLHYTADLDPSVRRRAISLISLVSHNFNPFLTYLAINYLDRFLSTQDIPQGKPWVLRLLAVSCVSLALKMRKAEFSPSDIQQGLIFDPLTVGRMEFLILGALKWRMRSITPFSFTNFFISFFKFKDPPPTQALKARATEIIFKAQHDVKLLAFKPSIIAASALLSASHELFPLQYPCFRKAISECLRVNKDNLYSCDNVMQETAKQGYESLLDMAWRSSTPVNVLDRRCWSSSSEAESEETNAMETTNAVTLDRETKRRRVGGSRNDDPCRKLSQTQQYF